MGKGYKDYRIDKRESFPIEDFEKISIKTETVKVSVQSTRAEERVQIWFTGNSSEKVDFYIEKKEEEWEIVTKETKEAGNVEIKIAIPENIKCLSVTTTSGRINIARILPEEIHIKTQDGRVIMGHLPDRNSKIYVTTGKGDVRAEFKAARVELEAETVSGRKTNNHEPNGKSFVKMEAFTISGDITVS